MFTEDLLVVFVSLSLSGLWLLYKAIGFQGLPKVDDPKGILIPSVVFISSSFISLYLLHFLAIEEIGEIIKPLVPLATFLLGQTLTKREKQENEKQKKIEVATLLAFSIEETIIEALSAIEGTLAYIKDNDELITSSNFKSRCKHYQPKIEDLYNRFRFEPEIFKSNLGRYTLFYIEKIKKHLELIASRDINPPDRLSELSDIRVFKIEGYENIIFLIREFIPKTECNYVFVDGCITKLKLEYSRLLNLEESNKSLKKYCEDKPDIEIKRHPQIYLYLSYDINTERAAIQTIERIFKRFDINSSLCE